MSSEKQIEFTKENIDTYLKEVAKEYRKQIGKNMPAEMILIGGASVLVNYGFRDMTTDIDAVIQAASVMKDVINRVGDRYDLPNGWLNQDFVRTESYSPSLSRFSEYYLESYAQQHGYENCVHYTDDGWSGGNFDRPDWKRLIADIEAGKVGTVLVKDMSRIGRDYLQTGFYTEVMFRQHNVHFIAISNNVDSNDQSSNEFAPFLNIMNEWYLRDLSRKQKAAIRVKGESGKPTNNSPIYGYKKDPADKYHWIIDEEAAAVIRRIFQLAIEGHGIYEISTILYHDKVETPAVHLAKQGRGMWKAHDTFQYPYSWSGSVVGRIIARPEYLGHTVNFRTHKESYKDKHSVANAPEDWRIFENTHEPIVDKETWELAQKLLATPRRIDTIGEPNPLTGLLFCADCGAKMYNHRARKSNTAKKTVDYYSCSSYSFAKQQKKDACSVHYIRTEAVRALILDTIRAASTYAISNQEAFMEQVRTASQIRQEEAAKDTKRKLIKDRKRIDELEAIIKKLYESYAVGRISDERFDILMPEYENEQKELRAAVAEAEQQLAVFAEDTAHADQFIEVAKRYTDFSELTTPMLNEFIDKVLIHEAEYIDGERTQEIEIYLKFIGRFDLPAPEPTPEEVQKEEANSKRRRRHRELYHLNQSGERKPGDPFELTCQVCGQPFLAKRRDAMYCGAACRTNACRKPKQKSDESPQDEAIVIESA